ncbi:hypothetical protein C4K07_3519 [Pseudomonas chlororaphis subsp. aureofaciens]|uniref:Uncharacterized protein n=1 Tax=Pseudomonas chlororaphis subsp. aureofaciens TaxID=587851 RepID=A0AAD1E7U7_9PSED|nr:hypothetical protein C4K07_3519 [Pseudomonas chlororaphis subsp. aureofaciens]
MFDSGFGTIYFKGLLAKADANPCSFPVCTFKSALRFTRLERLSRLSAGGGISLSSPLGKW